MPACNFSLRRVRGSPKANWLARPAMMVGLGFDGETLPQGIKWKNDQGWFPTSTSRLHMHSHTRMPPHKQMHIHTCTPHVCENGKGAGKEPKVGRKKGVVGSEKPDAGGGDCEGEREAEKRWERAKDCCGDAC